MPIDCKHWSECGTPMAGCCAQGHFGGKPSLGTCQKVCSSRSPMSVVPQSSVVAQVIHGAVGITKAVLHVGRASDEVIANRRAICFGCEFKKSVIGGIVTTCGKCGCSLQAKTVNAAERCPAGKW